MVKAYQQMREWAENISAKKKEAEINMALLNIQRMIVCDTPLVRQKTLGNFFLLLLF
jgi:hypothetical protein